MSANKTKTDTKSKKISLKLIFLIAVMGAFVGIFAKIITHEAPPQGAQMVAKKMPQFTLPSLLDTKTFISDKTLVQNAPVLVNIWASWCAPCRQEHTYITELATKHNVTIYGLNYKDKQENGQNFLKRYGNPFKEVMYDGEGLTTLNWGIRGVPETFIIDKKGDIIFRHKGAITPKDQNKILEIYKKAL